MPRIKIRLDPQFKYYWFPICIAAWTIIQSIGHAWWVFYGRLLLACEVQVERKLEFYLYMTYVYNGDECDNQSLNSYAMLNFIQDENSSEDFYFTQKLGIPRMYKHDGTMTESLMDLYLASDAIWIVTSVALLVGIMMRLKQGSALVFYLPWILVTFTIVAMDLFSALYFALKLRHSEIIQTAFIWKLDESTIMAIISGRLGFIWVLNLANMAYIIWFTRLTYKQRYSDERKRRNPKMRRQETEDRIKNWQLFYGEIETNETVASATNFHATQKCSFIDDVDLNYSSTFKELEDYNHKRKKFEGSTSEHELCSTFKSSSSIHNEPSTSTQATQGVSESTKKRVQITELVSHLPWSYINPRDPRDNEVQEKDLRPKRVVVLEPVKNLTICNPENEQVSRF